MTFAFKMNSTEQILQKRGLEDGGKTQQYIDNACLRYMDPYTPFDTGMLRDNQIINTDVGSGEINVEGPYAANLYYNPQFNFQGAPMRGAYWFERMKTDHKDDILKLAADVSGGKPQK